MLLFLALLIGVQAGIAGKKYIQGQILTGVENAPLILSGIGCFFTLIYSVFCLPPITMTVPILGKIFGVIFYLDGLNSFCLFCLFLCGALFVFFKRELGVSHIFLLPYTNVILLLLAGNLYFFVELLAFLMMISYSLSIGKSLAPFIGLASLLIGTILLPVQVGEQGNFAYLSFEIIRQIIFSPWILFCVLLSSCVLMGLAPWTRWRLHIARQGQGELTYSFMHLLLFLAGIYLLLRFYVDLGRNSETYWLSSLVKIIGVIGACYAGWQSLVVKQLYERVSCLYILGNAVLVQTVGLIASYMGSDHQQWIIFANDVLYFGLFTQLMGFTFVFLLSGFLKDYYKAQSNENLIPSSILISILLLSFLLSGLPPFAGYAVFWGNLQLLLTMPSGHYLSNILLGTIIIGLNAFILMLALMGWIRLILTGGVKSLQRALSELPDYFSLKLLFEVKIGIAFLFIITLFPGCIFIIAKSISSNVMNLSNIPHNFFTFSINSQQIVFTPWLIAMLFIIAVFFVSWFVSKQKINSLDTSLLDSNIHHNTYRPVIAEETSFSFGQSSFYLMLERRFSFIYIFSRINYSVYKFWVRLKKFLSAYVHHLNLMTWRYQNLLMLMGVAIILVSIIFIIW